MVFLVGGSGVSSFNDDEFAKVRQHFSLADDFLKDFDFNSLDVGGEPASHDGNRFFGILYRMLRVWPRIYMCRDF